MARRLPLLPVCMNLFSSQIECLKDYAVDYIKQKLESR
jgi:hypothetical protein